MNSNSDGTLVEAGSGLVCPWTRTEPRQPGYRCSTLIRSTLAGIGIGLGLSGCQMATPPPGQLAQVEQVVSGQTLTVRYVNGKTQERVRLLGVDAPDLQQHPWGANAQQVLAQAIASKTVLLEADVERGDRFGRRLVYLWQDGRLWNEQLVAAGYALAVSRSPNTKYEQRLARAQERARILGLGIWNPQLPMRQTPAEFRKLSRVRQP